jgi:hypothetical protein
MKKLILFEGGRERERKKRERGGDKRERERKKQRGKMKRKIPDWKLRFSTVTIFLLFLPDLKKTLYQ